MRRNERQDFTCFRLDSDNGKSRKLPKPRNCWQCTCNARRASCSCITEIMNEIQKYTWRYSLRLSFLDVIFAENMSPRAAVWTRLRSDRRPIFNSNEIALRQFYEVFFSFFFNFNCRTRLSSTKCAVQSMPKMFLNIKRFVKWRIIMVRGMSGSSSHWSQSIVILFKSFSPQTQMFMYWTDSCVPQMCI